MDMVTWIAVGSVATAAIVFLNLFLIFIKPRLEEPKFAVEFKMGEPFCGKASSRKLDPFIPANKDVDVRSTYWVRVSIRNSGRSVAHRCLGKLIGIWNNDEGKVIDQFEPNQLHWVTTSWGEVPFGNISLNRNDYQYLDVIVAQQGDEHLYICGDQFPWAKYEQRAIRNRLKPGNYILHITAYGDNVDPKTKYLSLIWGGQHFKDIFVEIHGTFEKAKAWLDERRND